MKASEQYKSSAYTESKQQDLAYTLELHAAIVRHIFSNQTLKRGRGFMTYLYYDLNAGQGIDDNGLDGSPLVFMNTFAAADIDYEAHFYEKHPPTYSKLCENLVSRPRYRIRLHHEDHNLLIGNLPERSRPQYGLVYTDPSDTGVPVDLLAHFNDCYPVLDILINISATNVKRVRTSTGKDMFLADMLAAIGKKFWLIRDKSSSHQWTMLFGTNWGEYPEFMNPKTGRRFYRVDSERGNDLLNHLNLTPGEYRDMIQPGLL